MNAHRSDVGATGFDPAVPGLAWIMLGCISGRELVAKGFAADVELASALDSTTAVPEWDPANLIREFRAG